MLSPTRARLSAMIPANGSPFTRNVPVKMTWFGRMTAGRNNILERQKAYQAESHVPTYLRGNGKHMYRVWLASYAVSTFVTGQQLYQLLQR